MSLHDRWRLIPSVRDVVSRIVCAQMFVVMLCAVALTASFCAAQDIPENARALVDQAQSDSAHGQWNEAAANYEKAVVLAPQNANLRIALGLALAKAGRFTDAIASYQAALELSPRNSAAEIDLAGAYRGVHNNDAARRLLERSSREHPKLAAPLAVLGDLDIELQTYEAAIKHLSAAIALDPANNETQDRLALAYKSKGDAPAALAQLAKSLARDPNDALAHFLRAQIYDDRNQDDRALPEAEKVLALQPQNLPGRAILGKILLRISETAGTAEAPALCSRAADVLKPIADAQPNDSETLFILARAYRCAGDAAEAEKTLAAFESASKILRASKENQNQALHLVHQANDRALQNDFPGALDLLQQALEKYPDYDAAYSQLAKLYYSAGDIEKASDAIARALQLAPYQPDSLYVQGKIFEKQGKLDDALSDFERATLVNPKESDAYFEMGAIYQQKNDLNRARAAYKKALEISPDDPDYRRALASLSAAAAPTP
jgi:tetratricopeptide (TPR) repeat protein